MKPRKRIKQEHVKHPYSKKKLLVVDSFEPSAAPPCPACRSGLVRKIKVVESEHQGGAKYNMLFCETCDKPVWVVPVN